MRARDDEATADAVRYLRARSRSPDRAARRFPEVDAALGLHEGPARSRAVAEAALLAGESSDAVGARLALTAATIGAYESLFFNVLDRMRARHWIVVTAIGVRPSPDAGAVLKPFAYHGDPLVLDVVLAALDGDTTHPLYASARLAVETYMLPNDARTDRILLRIGAESLRPGAFAAGSGAARAHSSPISLPVGALWDTKEADPGPRRGKAAASRAANSGAGAANAGRSGVQRRPEKV